MSIFPEISIVDIERLDLDLDRLIEQYDKSGKESQRSSTEQKAIFEALLRLARLSDEPSIAEHFSKIGSLENVSEPMTFVATDALIQDIHHLKNALMDDLRLVSSDLVFSDYLKETVTLTTPVLYGTIPSEDTDEAEGEKPILRKALTREFVMVGTDLVPKALQDRCTKALYSREMYKDDKRNDIKGNIYSEVIVKNYSTSGGIGGKNYSAKTVFSSSITHDDDESVDDYLWFSDFGFKKRTTKWGWDYAQYATYHADYFTPLFYDAFTQALYQEDFQTFDKTLTAQKFLCFGSLNHIDEIANSTGRRYYDNHVIKAYEQVSGIVLDFNDFQQGLLDAAKTEIDAHPDDQEMALEMAKKAIASALIKEEALAPLLAHYSFSYQGSKTSELLDKIITFGRGIQDAATLEQLDLYLRDWISVVVDTIDSANIERFSLSDHHSYRLHNKTATLYPFIKKTQGDHAKTLALIGSIQGLREKNDTKEMRLRTTTANPSEGQRASATVRERKVDSAVIATSKGGVRHLSKEAKRLLGSSPTFKSIAELIKSSKTVNGLEIDSSIIKQNRENVMSLSDVLDKIKTIAGLDLSLRRPYFYAFRRLGRHKARGLFVPYARENDSPIVAIDANPPIANSDIHELGHHYDISNNSLDVDQQTHIVSLARHYLDDLSGTIYANKKSYYFSFEEIFARAFEVGFMLEQGNFRKHHVKSFDRPTDDLTSKGEQEIWTQIWEEVKNDYDASEPVRVGICRPYDALQAPIFVDLQKMSRDGDALKVFADYFHRIFTNTGITKAMLRELSSVNNRHASTLGFKEGVRQLVRVGNNMGQNALYQDARSFDFEKVYPVVYDSSLPTNFGLMSLRSLVEERLTLSFLPPAPAFEETDELIRSDEALGLEADDESKIAEAMMMALPDEEYTQDELDTIDRALSIPELQESELGLDDEDIDSTLDDSVIDLLDFGDEGSLAQIELLGAEIALSSEGLLSAIEETARGAEVGEPFLTFRDPDEQVEEALKDKTVNITHVQLKMSIA